MPEDDLRAELERLRAANAELQRQRAGPQSGPNTVPSVTEGTKSLTTEEGLRQIRLGFRRRGLDLVTLASLAEMVGDSHMAAIMESTGLPPAPADAPLAKFLDAGGDRPYRELVEYHLQRQSTEQLRASVLGEVGLLPYMLRSGASDYVDATNQAFAHNQAFWQNATCFEAATAIWMVAARAYGDEQVRQCLGNPLSDKYNKLAFGLYQIPTLSFAYSASTQLPQRLLMGIRKGSNG